MTTLLQPSQTGAEPENPSEPEASGSRWAKAHHVLLYFLGAAALIWLGSGFYQVNANEEAIVERLGQFVTDGLGKPMIVEPGLHYALPWPIDRVHKVPVSETRTLHLVEFNAPPAEYEALKRDLRAAYVREEVISALFDPYLITGDKNVVHVEIAVQYRIRNSEDWLMTVAHDIDHPGVTGPRDELFEQIAAHVLIKTLARLPVDRVLFEGNDRLPALLSDALSDAMKIPDPSDPSKTIDLGVEISKVDVQPPQPPALVKPAFELVLSARSEAGISKAKAVSLANALRDAALADQSNMRREAEAYADQTIKTAQGEADRFKSVLTEYDKAPDITRYRLYVDALGDVARQAERIYWVRKGQHIVITIDPPKFDAGLVAPK